MPQLIETIDALQERGCGFRSITEAIDTTTAGGRLIFHIFGALAGNGNNDTYSALSSINSVFINLDTVAHSDAGPTIAATTAFGLDVSGTITPTVVKDTIISFENADTGSGADVIYGSSVVNVLRSGAGDDKVFGFGDDDTLEGGDGIDYLAGGVGRDDLWGGDKGNFSGDLFADTYVFQSVLDSGLTKATRDTIWDFVDGQDLIDIGAIDANTATSPDDGFSFIGENVAFALATPGQLRAVLTATGWTIEGSHDADTAAEFSIVVYDPTHAVTWTGADFVL